MKQSNFLSAPPPAQFRVETKTPGYRRRQTFFAVGTAPLVRALVTQDLEGDRQKLARDRNTRLVHSFELQMFVLGAKLRVCRDGRLNGLDKRLAQPLVALLDNLAVVSLAARRIGRGHKSGIGGQLLRIAETADVVNLGVDQPGEELRDTGDGLQKLHLAIGLRHSSDRGFRQLDPFIDVADEFTPTIYLDAVDF